MDEDLRAALFEDTGEDGDFEELQDDFIEQVPNKMLYFTCMAEFLT